ncbi:hypothetical protein GCM10009850_072140 [Nonomuraea monospora]|uniref:Lipocalin-like domain-containing protein n=1 Tax=Nonomuraea monospora TaxID=568818 RepID=A0ABN3CRB1_9ACTN
MQPFPGHEQSLPAGVCADLSLLLWGRWAITGLQLAGGEMGPAYLISASSGEWSLLSAYPREAAAQWSASLYRGPDEYVVLEREEFTRIVAGTHDDRARVWAAKEHLLLPPEEHEDGPAGDEPAGIDGETRMDYSGFMTIHGSSAVYTELLSRQQQFGRFVITGSDLLALDEGVYIETSGL